MENIRSSVHDVKRQYSRYTAGYAASSDGIWRLKHIVYETAFTQKGNLNLYLQDDCNVTSYQALEKSIPYNEQLGYHDIFLYNTGDYDTAFWSNYTSTMPTPSQEEAFNAHQLARPRTKIEKINNVLSKIRLSLGISTVETAVSQTDVLFTSGQFVAGGEVKPNYLWEYRLVNSTEFQLKPYASVGIESSFSFRPSRYEINLGKFTFEKAIKPARFRPMHVATTVKAGGWNQRHFVGSYENGMEFYIGRKKIDSESVDLFLERRGLVVIPSLRLSVDKSKRMKFFTEAGYSYFIGTKNGIFLQEDQLLFRKRAFVSASDPAVTFESEYPDSINSQWIFNVGITLSY